MIVLAQSHGRLGNKLWTFANLAAFAIEHGVELYNPAFVEDAGSFQLNGGRSAGRRSVAVPGSIGALIANWSYRANLRLRAAPTLLLKEGDLLEIDSDPSFIELARSVKHIFLSGFYFAAPSSLEKHRDEVLRILTPRPHIVAAITHVFSETRSRFDVVVGIHARRTDYRTFCDGIMFYDDEELLMVMRHLRDCFAPRKVCFHMFSDEKLNQCAYRHVACAWFRGTAVQDLFALSLCDYIVGPHSSFSQWASFAGKKPLHILDWKAVERSAPDRAVRLPLPGREFAVFEASDFGGHCSRRVVSSEVLWQ